MYSYSSTCNIFQLFFLFSNIYVGILEQFFAPSGRVCVEALEQCLAQLRKLLAHFDRQTTWRFHSTSLLMIYESETPGARRLRVSLALVDFAHAYMNHAGVENRQPQLDEGCRLGVRNVIAVLARLRQSHAPRALRMPWSSTVKWCEADSAESTAVEFDSDVEVSTATTVDGDASASESESECEEAQLHATVTTAAHDSGAQSAESPASESPAQRRRRRHSNTNESLDPRDDDSVRVCIVWCLISYSTLMCHAWYFRYQKAMVKCETTPTILA